MCNAANHSRYCTCGFGGDTGGGGRSYSCEVETMERPSPRWAAGTVESYTRHTNCPVCGEPVWFYRSPYDGRVFFDNLGWPWPKHDCTDNPRKLRAARRHPSSPSSGSEPAWRDGWEPLLSVDSYTRHERLRIGGRFRGRYLELYLPGSELFDSASPVFLRELPGKPDLFEMTFLRSRGTDVRGHSTLWHSGRGSAMPATTCF
jgi:hypothetical protein